VSEAAQHLATHGLGFSQKTVDLSKLRTWKDSVVNQLTGGLSRLARERKVRVVHGTGAFVGSNRLRVNGSSSEGSTIQFAHAVIATGSEAVDPFLLFERSQVEGAAAIGKDPRIVDSTGALDLPAIPRSMLVIGGGVIGLELATVYAALGADVDIVEKGDRLLSTADRDLVDVWTRRNAQRMRSISSNTVVSAIKNSGHSLEVAFRGTRSDCASYDLILVAVGRTPNGNRLDATRAGVLVGENGFIPVDSQMRTNVPHIFAVGDVVAGPMLAHRASHQGHVAAEAAAGLPTHFDARVIPEVAYTDPEIAWVGVTEESARQSGRTVRRAVFPWIAAGRAIAHGRSEGLTKLLVDQATGRVVGGGIVGTHAGDLIGELGLAIEMGCHPTDLQKTIHPHPTLCESIGLAASVYEGSCTELPNVSVQKRPRVATDAALPVADP